MKKITTIEFIWSPEQKKDCKRISEDLMTDIDQFRCSCGLEIDRETGDRYYWVPKDLVGHKNSI